MSSTTDAAPPEPDSPPATGADPFEAARQRAGAALPAGDGAAARSAAPARPEAPAAGQPARRSGTGFVTVLAMSLLAAAGGAAGGAALMSRPQLLAGLGITLPGAAGTDASRLAGLQADLEALRERLGRLETRVPSAVQPAQAGGPPPGAVPGAEPGPQPAATSAPAPAVAQLPAPGPAAPAPDIAPLRQELAGFAGRLTAIETRLAALDPTGSGGAMIAGLQADVARLRVAVQQLEAQAASGPPVAATLAVLSLVEAAGGPAPFVPAFESARAAIPGLPELAALEPFARSGAPTRTQLEQRFAGLAPAVAQMQAQTESGTGITGWFQRLFANMVRVERADAAAGTGPAAALARARARLEEGDLAGALREMETITPAPDPVRAWVAGARARLDLEAALAAVRGAVQRPAASASASASASAARPVTAQPVPTVPGPAAPEPVSDSPAVAPPPAGSGPAAPTQGPGR